MKKLVSIFVAVTMLLGLMMPVSAALVSTSGVTKIHTITNDMANDTLTVQYTSASGTIETFTGAVSAESPAEYLFEYTNGDTKYSYSVIDKDENGNYLIYAADRYGTLTMNQDPVNNLFDPDPLATYQTVEWTDGDGNTVDPETAGWGSDTNIATWLNNDFYNGLTGAEGETGATGVITSENLSLTKLDTVIKPYIVTHDWVTEGNNQNQNFTYRLTAASKGGFTVNCKIALMSATEYIEYKDKIGYAAYNTNGNIFATGWSLLRTPYRNGSYQFTYIHEETGNLKTVTKDNYDSFYFRPLFYINSDYFKKVKIENPGTEVVNILKTDYSYAELVDTNGGVYTAEELAAMGIESKALKSANNGRTDTAALTVGETKVDVARGVIDEENGSPLTVAASSPEAYVFSHTDDNGTVYTYSLLDRDAEGDYYVWANERYGQLTATKNPVNGIFDPHTADSYATLTYTDANGEPMDTSEWDDINIAQYLNTDFLTGDGKTTSLGTISGGKALEDTVKQYIVEKEWYMEGNNKSDVVDEAGNITTPISNFHMNTVTANDFIITAKVGLLSWSEYIKYSAKIGYQTTDYTSGAQMVLLRTANDLNETGSYYIRQSDGAVMTCNPGTAANNYGSQRIRPSFYLSPDYFKKVKLTSAGSAVVEMLNNEIGYDALLVDNGGAYTADELAALGVQPLLSEAIRTDASISFNLHNSTAEAVTPTVLLASYDENCLVQALLDNTKTIEAGSYQTYQFDYAGTDDFKIIVLTSMSTLTPFCRVITADDFPTVVYEYENAAAVTAAADAADVYTVSGLVVGAREAEMGVVTVSDTDGNLVAADNVWLASDGAFSTKIEFPQTEDGIYTVDFYSESGADAQTDVVNSQEYTNKDFEYGTAALIVPGAPHYIQDRETAYITVLSELEESAEYTLSYSLDGILTETLPVTLEGGGKRVQRVPVSAEKNDIYKSFTATLTDTAGNTVDTVSERLTLVDFYEKNPFDEYSFIGVNTDDLAPYDGIKKARTLTRKNAQLLENIGVNKVRRTVSKWEVMESVVGLTDFEQSDYRVEEYAAAGIEQMLGATCEMTERRPYTKENLDAFTAYIAKINDRYGDYANIAEPWNEPDLDKIANSRSGMSDLDSYAIAYANLMKHYYLSSKAKRPDLEVVSGCVSSLTNGGPYLTKLFANRILPYSDGYSFHPYNFGKNPSENFASHHLNTFNSFNRSSGGWLKTYATEFGYRPIIDAELAAEYGYTESTDTSGLAPSLEKCAEYLLKAYTLLAQHRTEASYMYCLYDNTGTYGLITDNNVVKDNFLMLPAMTQMLNGTDYVGEIKSEDTSLHVFNKLGEPVIVAWNNENLDTVYSFDNLVNVTDINGNAVEAMQEVSIGEAPVYITGAGEDVLRQAAYDEALAYLDSCARSYDFDFEVLKDGSAEEVKALIDAIYTYGQDLISAYDSSGDGMADLTLELYDLHVIANKAAQVYSTLHSGEYSLANDFNSAYTQYVSSYKSSEKYATKLYTEKIFRYAGDCAERAENALLYTEQTDFAYARAAAYDRMSCGLIAWGIAISEKETVDDNVGVLMYSPTTDCTLGTNQSFVLIVENKSGHDVSGTISISDDNGVAYTITTEDAVTVNAGDYLSKTVAFSCSSWTDTDETERKLTVRLTDSQGKLISEGYIQMNIVQEAAE